MSIKTSKIFRKVISLVTAAAASVIMLPSAVTASAASSVPQPRLSAREVYSDMIKISVDNANQYPAGTSFGIYRSGRFLGSCDRNKAGCIELKDTGVSYFKPDTNYTYSIIPVLPAAGAQQSLTASIKVRTASYTTYSIAKNTALFKPQGAGMRKKSKTAAQIFAKGSVADSKGTLLAGKKLTRSGIKYVKITDGMYSGYYVKYSSVTRFRGADAGGLTNSEIKTLRKTVADYAASMAGGQYVYGGASYRRTDCSGLTMLAYAQVGIILEHSAYRQSLAGKEVSLGSMQPGDLICMNYGSHVAMYIGGNRMVHAMNYYDGIKIEPISQLVYYHVDTVRRLIY